MNKSHPLRSICFAVLFSAFFTTGNAAPAVPDPDTAAAVRAMFGGPKVPVEHVVVIRLKNQGSVTDRVQLIRATKSFRAILGITRITVGTSVWILPSNTGIGHIAGKPPISPRPNVDPTFDVALVMEFKNAKALS